MHTRAGTHDFIVFQIIAYDEKGFLAQHSKALSILLTIVIGNVFAQLFLQLAGAVDFMHLAKAFHAILFLIIWGKCVVYE